AGLQSTERTHLSAVACITGSRGISTGLRQYLRKVGRCGAISRCVGKDCGSKGHIAPVDYLLIAQHKKQRDQIAVLVACKFSINVEWCDGGCRVHLLLYWRPKAKSC